jgi:hypothetical protein
MKLASLGLALALLGCGGSDDAITDLEGVYTIDTHTLNLAGCDAEGDSVLAQRSPNLFIKSENFLGEKFVNVNECESVAECSADASDDSTLHIGQWGFQDGSDAAGWVSTSAFASKVGDECQATRFESKLVDEGGSVRIEERTSHATFAPGGGSDECPDDAALTASATAPCEQLEVVTATFTVEF